MVNLVKRTSNCVAQLDKINVEDLEFVERDLNVHGLVSIGFLLYGDERGNAEFVLQKLLVLFQSASTNKRSSGLLQKYASINPTKWRHYIVEGLAIIGAKRIIRKLGFQWEELRQHFLPHIAELSLHIHPLLKALYKICSQMTTTQAGRFVLDINDQHTRSSDDHLRFYNFDYLEIFLLDWITRRTITMGDNEMNGANVQVLIDYFKLNEMDILKMILIGTIESNRETVAYVHKDTSHKKPDKIVMLDTKSTSTLTPHPASIPQDIQQSECYTVRREQAGFVLIINQETFHRETERTMQHLMPSKNIEKRLGTHLDKERLIKVFSSFNYMPEVYNNLTHIEILHHIREIVKRSLLYDSLIVCILSHGNEGYIYGSNSIPVAISEIEQVIIGETLQGKPKMLIIQSCQTKLTTIVSSRKPQSPTVDGYADMIKAMSTVSGYFSWRNTQTGSWFIQTLCDQVNKLGDKRHVLDILMSVTKEVTKLRGDKNELMVPLTSHTLRKYFFLPPRRSQESNESVVNKSDSDSS